MLHRNNYTFLITKKKVISADINIGLPCVCVCVASVFLLLLLLGFCSAGWSSSLRDDSNG